MIAVWEPTACVEGGGEEGGGDRWYTTTFWKLKKYMHMENSFIISLNLRLKLFQLSFW